MKVAYRKLKKYKYQLMKDYVVRIALKLKDDIVTPFIALTTEGELTIKSRYAWDGASGPTFDTKTFMRGSLVHDALYQLMREGHLDYKKYRKYADELLRDICKEDGMAKWRAWYVYTAVRIFGEYGVRPPEPLQDIIYYVP